MTGSLPRALLVDLDDTILAFDIVSGQAWQVVCGRYAPHLGVDASTLFHAIQRRRSAYWSDPERHRWGRLHLGQTRSAIVRDALDELGTPSSEDIPDLAGEVAAAYEVERTVAMYPLPGAVETLRGFGNRGVRLALLTNGASAGQRAKIARFGLGPLFDCIVIEEEFGAGKPDERVYYHALTQLGAEPADAWMVGNDLEVDVAGAQRLGIWGVWVDARGSGLPHGSATRPDRVVRALAELLET